MLKTTLKTDITKLFQRVLSEGTMRVPCDSTPEAHKLRFVLYNFRNQLIINASETDQELALCAQGFKFSIEGKSVLIIREAEEHKYHQQIMRALS